MFSLTKKAVYFTLLVTLPETLPKENPNYANY